VSLQPSQNQAFTATVSGTSNTAVTWSLNPPLGNLASGATTALYVAPSTAPTTQSVTITATSIADPSKIATAAITLLEAITVSLSPSTVSLAPSGTQQFTPTVLGTSNTAVTWSINPSVGTISSTGLYTAPSSILTSQTVTVTAQSVADPTESASAPVSLSTPVTSFTYYVDSANGLDSNPGTLAEPWQTIAKVNSTTLSPGQSVAFKAGGVWREQLTVPASGTAGNPITFTSYGVGAQPIITGANVVSSWTLASGTVYQATVTTQPYVVIYNGARLQQNSGAGSTTAPNTWDWSSNTLYLNVGGNPTKTVEAGQRSEAVLVNDKAYITVQGLTLAGANQADLYATGNANHLSVLSNTLTNSGTSAWKSALMLNGVSDGLIVGNTVSFSYQGIELSGYGAATTNNNDVRANTLSYLDADGIGVTPAGGSGPENNMIEYNNCSYVNQFVDDGACIHTFNTGTGNVIRYNVAYSSGTATTKSAGIMLDSPGAGGAATMVYGNIAYFNTNGCIDDGSGGADLIYNAGELNTFSPATGVTFENNIACPSSGKYVVSTYTGGGFTFNYNLYCSGGATNPFYNTYNGTGYTFSGWQGLICGDGYSINGANPLFVNPTTDFALQSGSPAMGAGVYIPGVSTANPPNIGAK
jgi:hypothetical protein